MDDNNTNISYVRLPETDWQDIIDALYSKTQNSVFEDPGVLSGSIAGFISNIELSDNLPDMATQRTQVSSGLISNPNQSGNNNG